VHERDGRDDTCPEEDGEAIAEVTSDEVAHCCLHRQTRVNKQYWDD
jgi:hypothetical protein